MPNLLFSFCTFGICTSDYKQHTSNLRRRMHKYQKRKQQHKKQEIFTIFITISTDCIDCAIFEKISCKTKKKKQKLTKIWERIKSIFFLHSIGGMHAQFKYRIWPLSMSDSVQPAQHDEKYVKPSDPQIGENFSLSQAHVTLQLGSNFRSLSI